MDLDDLQKAHNKEREEFALVSNPVFRRIFFLIRSVGCLVMLINAITEYAYLFKHQFSSMSFFIMYTTTCFLKLFIPFMIVLITFKRKVFGKVPKAYTDDIDLDARLKLSKEYRNAGFLLYAAMPLSYVTGFFRLMGSTNFAKEVGVGFCFDLVFTLALFFI